MRTHSYCLGCRYSLQMYRRSSSSSSAAGCGRASVLLATCAADEHSSQSTFPVMPDILASRVRRGTRRQPCDRRLGFLTLIPPLRHLSGAAPTARMTVPSEERRAAAAIHPQQRQGREKRNGGGVLTQGQKPEWKKEELQRRKLTGPGSVFSLNSLLIVVIFWY